MFAEVLRTRTIVVRHKLKSTSAPNKAKYRQRLVRMCSSTFYPLPTPVPVLYAFCYMS